MIASPDLAALGHVKHGFFTRDGGYSEGLYASLNCGLGSGDDRETVIRNRARVTDTLGIEADRLVTLYQYHSPDVIVVTEPWKGDDRPKADAMVTAEPGILLGVLTADCGPILFADRKAGVVGAAHAGWKGALTGITDQTVLAMERLGAHRYDMVAVIGPTISQGNYEVGPEFVETFVKNHPENRHWFKPAGRQSYSMFDLPGYISNRLEAFGVGQVSDLAVCTYPQDNQLFSYRRTTHARQPDYGRQISAIMLAP
jgi:hypothetical protein